MHDSAIEVDLDLHPMSFRRSRRAAQRRARASTGSSPHHQAEAYQQALDEILEEPPPCLTAKTEPTPASSNSNAESSLPVTHQAHCRTITTPLQASCHPLTATPRVDSQVHR